MGCCLSRVKDDKLIKEYQDYDSEVNKLCRNSTFIDTNTLSGLLIAKDAEKIIPDDMIETDLPTFNYNGTIRDSNGIDYLNDESFLNKNCNFPDHEDISLIPIEQNINLNNAYKAPYFSINSTSIIGKNFQYSNNEDSQDDYIYGDIKNNMSNVFSKKRFIFLYFEINHFIFWARDYLINLYPEINLVMIVEINDSKLTQEKIYFTRSKDDINKYIPMKKKCDLNNLNYRILQTFEVAEENREFPFKISMNFYTYTNHKMISLCSDEIFIKVTKEGEMQKYKMYQNIYMKHYNKKVGNLIFNFSYKSNEIYTIDLEEQKSICEHKLTKLQNFSKFEENQELMFIYYRIENSIIKENGNYDYTKYFSIKDIDEMEIGEELKGEVKLDRLLELINLVKKKFEFYQIIKKINNYFATKEFKEDKLITFKEFLLTRLEELSAKKDLNDKFLISFIFNSLKKICFKIKALNSGVIKRQASKGNLNNKNVKDENEKYQIRNTELLINFFTVTFTFLKSDIQEDISLSALNYIFKYLEESLIITINGRTFTSDDYFFDLIVEKKYYNKFFDLLLKYYEYQACVQPIFSIFAKLIRLKKAECPEIIEFFNTEKFLEVLKKIIRIHDCNSVIMSNIFSTVFNLIDYLEIDTLLNTVSLQRLREIFNYFKMSGFDFIHETIINLIKGILIKLSDKNRKSTQDMNASITFTTPTKSNVELSNLVTASLSDEEYSEVIIIFSSALLFIRNKILMLDFLKLAKWMNSLLTHLYTISHIINTSLQNKSQKIMNVINDKKITEFLVDCLYSLADKKVLVSIDSAYEMLDTSLIKVKIMIFRTLFHVLLLIKNLQDQNISLLQKHTAEKLIRVMKLIENYDIVYNPNELFKLIETNSRKMMKADQYTEHLLILHRNLQDYYTRYKTKAPEYIKELMSIVKKKEE